MVWMNAVNMLDYKKMLVMYVCDIYEMDYDNSGITVDQFFNSDAERKLSPDVVLACREELVYRNVKG